MYNLSQEIVNKVNAKIIDSLKNNPKNWTQGWRNKNFVSCLNHQYSGFNTIWLSMQPFKRKVYGTFLQWKNEGCTVKAGSSSVRLLMYKTFKKEVENKKGIKEDKTFPLLKVFNVFNIEQIEGDISKFNNLDNTDNKVLDIKTVDQYIYNLNAKICHDGGNKAYYRPSTDSIHIPSKESFIDTKTSNATSNYYGVLFHELTHWTGDKNRLNRNLCGNFGNPEYAFEELIAELGAAYQCSNMNIDADPRSDHSSYINSWIKAIQDNDKAILKASSLASKAVNYMNELQKSAVKIAA